MLIFFLKKKGFCRFYDLSILDLESHLSVIFRKQFIRYKILSVKFGFSSCWSVTQTKKDNVPRDLPWKGFIDWVRFVLIKKINSVYLFLTDFTSTFIQTDANVSNHITQRNYEYILSQWFDLRNSSVNFSFIVRLQTNWHKKEWCVKDLRFSRQPVQRINIHQKGR